ncbi:MAG TPA: N-acetylmuramoyl-L-alanine amidase-like domain-containing protein [Chroococcales cyanobacterium]
MAKSASNHWNKLPIGEVIGKVALELQYTPYQSNTLERSADREICSANLRCLDCVTFFESTLAIARLIKKGKSAPNALLPEIKFLRYRDGVLNDYSSRLHYTTDWLENNEKKHVIKILRDLPGEVAASKTINFMSTHPDSYKQLAAHPDLIPKIKAREDDINTHPLKFVPLGKIGAVESMLKTGDIVAIATDHDGLDFAHTGLIVRGSDDVAHFMDASSRKAVMQVILEKEPLAQALGHAGGAVGAVFARPLEP